MKSGQDTNAGTSRITAWLTIQRAANSATPGSTVYIGPGIYYETVTINVEGNARDGPITFTSLISNNVPVISGRVSQNPSADETFNVIYIEDKSYLRLINLELTNLRAVECSGVRIIGSGTNIGRFHAYRYQNYPFPFQNFEICTFTISVGVVKMVVQWRLPSTIQIRTRVDDK